MTAAIEAEFTFQYSETGHDGPGWYYWPTEYPDEGSCGAFTFEADARAHCESAHDGDGETT